MFKNRVLYLLAFLGLFVFLASLPFYLSFRYQDFMIFLFINILVVVSYRIMALTGDFSLIHVVFMGVGSYSTALITKELGLSFWLSMPIAGIITGFIAFLFSFPLFRMRGLYFLIGSFAAGEAIRLCWIYFGFFGGPMGLSGIASPKITLPFLGSYVIWQPIPYYFLTLAIVSICLFILYRIEHSRIGLTLHAIHFNDLLAESIGINIWRYKTMIFVISSFFVGVAGVLFVHYLGSVNPKQFGVDIMIYVLVWVIVGGVQTFIGPIIGVILLSIFNTWLMGLEELRPLIYGLILIGVMLLLPYGLESLPSKIAGLFQRSYKVEDKSTRAVSQEE